MIDPGTQPGGEDYNAYCRRRWGGDGWTHSLRAKGKKVGAPFADWKVWPNTLNAHRLMRLAGEDKAKVDELKKALFAACYENGQNVSDIEQLVEIGASAGLLSASPEAIRAYLTSSEGTREVQAEIREWSQRGVSGVPYFIVDGDAVDRPYGFSGAVGADQLVDLFNEVSGSDS